MRADQKEWNVAFTKASEPYWDNMFRLAMSLARRRDRADDILQTSLLRAVKYFPRFAEARLCARDPLDLEVVLADPGARSYLKSWLLKITKNVFLGDAMELDAWAHSAESDEALRSLAAPEPVPEGKLEDEFYRLASDDRMRVALQALNPRQRSILYLIADGHSYKETAALLEIPIGTVMSALARGIAKVKAQLGERTRS